MSENCYRICAVFSLKDNVSKNTFVDWCNGDNGLKITRGWEGCISLKMFEARENPNKVIIWQKWTNKESQEAYIKHRHDDGTFDLLTPLMSAPPDINPIKEMVMKSDKEQIEDVVKGMCSTDYNKVISHMHENCLIIRPSGNPLDVKGYKNMMTSNDVSVELNEFISINKLEIHEDVAFVCYTSHGKFNYKGTENDDFAVFTSILKKIEGKWVVIHGQRSKGRNMGCYYGNPPKF